MADSQLPRKIPRSESAEGNQMRLRSRTVERPTAWATEQEGWKKVSRGKRSKNTDAIPTGIAMYEQEFPSLPRRGGRSRESPKHLDDFETTAHQPKAKTAKKGRKPDTESQDFESGTDTQMTEADRQDAEPSPRQGEPEPRGKATQKVAGKRSKPSARKRERTRKRARAGERKDRRVSWAETSESEAPSREDGELSEKEDQEGARSDTEPFDQDEEEDNVARRRILLASRRDPAVRQSRGPRLARTVAVHPYVQEVNKLRGFYSPGHVFMLQQVPGYAHKDVRARTVDCEVQAEHRLVGAQRLRFIARQLEQGRLLDTAEDADASRAVEDWDTLPLAARIDRLRQAEHQQLARHRLVTEEATRLRRQVAEQEARRAQWRFEDENDMEEYIDNDNVRTHIPYDHQGRRGQGTVVEVEGHDDGNNPHIARHSPRQALGHIIEGPQEFAQDDPDYDAAAPLPMVFATAQRQRQPPPPPPVTLRQGLALDEAQAHSQGSNLVSSGGELGLGVPPGLAGGGWTLEHHNLPPDRHILQANYVFQPLGHFPADWTSDTVKTEFRVENPGELDVGLNMSRSAVKRRSRRHTTPEGAYAKEVFVDAILPRLTSKAAKHDGDKLGLDVYLGTEDGAPAVPHVLDITQFMEREMALEHSVPDLASNPARQQLIRNYAQLKVTLLTRAHRARATGVGDVSQHMYHLTVELVRQFKVTGSNRWTQLDVDVIENRVLHQGIRKLLQRAHGGVTVKTNRGTGNNNQGGHGAGQQKGKGAPATAEAPYPNHRCVNCGPKAKDNHRIGSCPGPCKTPCPACPGKTLHFLRDCPKRRTDTSGGSPPRPLAAIECCQCVVHGQLTLRRRRSRAELGAALRLHSKLRTLAARVSEGALGTPRHIIHAVLQALVSSSTPALTKPYGWCLGCVVRLRRRRWHQWRPYQAEFFVPAGPEELHLSVPAWVTQAPPPATADPQWVARYNECVEAGLRDTFEGLFKPSMRVCPVKLAAEGFSPRIVSRCLSGAETFFMETPPPFLRRAPAERGGPNYPSVVEHIEAVGAEHARRREVGVEEGPLSYVSYAVTPQLDVVKPRADGTLKHRLAWDFTRQGLNGVLQKFPCSYPTIHHAISHLRPSSFMAKRDWKDAFWNLPQPSRMADLQGCYDPVTRHFYRSRTTNFGYAPAPGLQMEFGTEFKRVMARRGADKVELMMDDFLLIGHTFDECARSADVHDTLAANIGVERSIPKDEGPSQALEFVGIELSTVGDGVARAGAARLEKYLQLLRAWQEDCSPGSTTTLGSVASLAGRLNFIAPFIWGASSRLRSFYDVMYQGLQEDDDGVFADQEDEAAVSGEREGRKQPSLPPQWYLSASVRRRVFAPGVFAEPKAWDGEAVLEVTQELRDDVEWWLEQAQKRNGVPLWLHDEHARGIWRGVVPDTDEFLDQTSCTAGGIDVITTDACTHRHGPSAPRAPGGGFWFRSERHQIIFSDAETLSYNINGLELVTAKLAVQHFANMLAGKRVLVRIDNTAAVAAINRGTSPSKQLHKIAKELAELCWKHHISLKARHIAGVNNGVADGLSRGVVAPSSCDYMLKPEHYQAICSLLPKKAKGRHTLDGFALPDGSNSHCERFCSLQQPFERTPLRGENAWVNCDYKDVDKALDHILAEKRRFPTEVSATVLLPDWPAPWQRKLRLFQQLKQFPAGSELFETVPAKHSTEIVEGEATATPALTDTRKSLGPTRWPVIAWRLD